MCVHECVKCRDVSECVVMWRTVPEADVDVERLEFACNRVATAAEGTTSLVPPQGEAAHGTEGAPSELSLAAPQGLIPRREVTFDSSLLREQKACTETGAAPFDRESLQEFECRTYLFFRVVLT